MEAHVAKAAEESFSDVIDVREGFSKPESKAIIAAVLNEEGKAPESVWDFVQGITAVARGIAQQDDRVTMEQRAGKLLSKISA